MVEHARRARKARTPTPFFREPGNSLGDEALEFTRWFAKSKYQLMGSFLGELTGSDGGPKQVRERFCRTLTHAHRVHAVRGVVTFVLALGVLAAAASAVANAIDVPAPTGILERAAAISTSLSVLLVAARLALDRYLERCDVAATFLAIELGAANSNLRTP